MKIGINKFRFNYFARKFTLGLFFLAATVSAREFYVSPNGEPDASGLAEEPLDVSSALSKAQAGDIIWLQSGIYSLNTSLLINATGEENSPIKMLAIENGEAIFNFSQMEEDPSNRGVIMDGDYWEISGLVIEEAGDNGMLLSGSYNQIKNCIFRKNRDSGLQLSRYNTNAESIEDWPSHNLIVGCISHDNSDSDHEDADGFAPKLTTGVGNVFRHCISHHNIDDGWDLYAKSETGPIGEVTLEYCIAHNNGTLSDGSSSGNGDKNGFKLGSSGILVNHRVIHCVAFNNGKHGFTDNGNTSSIQFFNNSSYNNGDYNFHTRDGASHQFANNLSLGGGHTDRIVGNLIGPNALNDQDTEWPVSVSQSDFVSMTPGPNDNPLSNGFLQPVENGILVDAGGILEGLDFAGEKPDLGAIELGLEIVKITGGKERASQIFYSRGKLFMHSRNPDPGIFVLDVYHINGTHIYRRKVSGNELYQGLLIQNTVKGNSLVLKLQSPKKSYNLLILP